MLPGNKPLPEIGTWISNYIRAKSWGVITRASSILYGWTPIEVRASTINYIPLFYVDVITYAYKKVSVNLLVEENPGLFVCLNKQCDETHHWPVKFNLYVLLLHYMVLYRNTRFVLYFLDLITSWSSYLIRNCVWNIRLYTDIYLLLGNKNTSFSADL